MIGRTINLVREAARHNKRLFTRRVLPSIQKAPDEADETDIDTIRRRITAKELSEAEILFRALDTDGDGYVGEEELTDGLRRFKLPTGQKELKLLFEEIDTHGNGLIDIQEFTVFVEARKDKLRKAYRWIMKHSSNGDSSEQTNKTNGFTARTLRAAAKRSGVNLSDEDIFQIMKSLSKHGDAPITYDNFVNCMLLAPPCNPKSFLDSWYIDAFSDDAQSECTIPREVRLLYGDGEKTFLQEAAKKIGCGGAAGCLSRTMTAPIDRIRILMMTSGQRLGLQGAFQLATSGGTSIMSLFQGNTANCVKIVPEMGIKLFMFDMVKNKVAGDPENVTVSERFLAGGIAGVSSQLSVYPLEVIKTRLSIAAPGEMRGMAGCTRQILAQGGYRALYAGVGPSVLGIMPYAAIDLTINSMLKDLAANKLQAQKCESSVPVLLGCGMVSSGTAALVTFPLNVIRTKAQSSGGSFGSVFNSIRVQGWKAFYRGLTPSLIKVLPATSISYAAYEYLGGHWDMRLYEHRNRC